MNCPALVQGLRQYSTKAARHKRVLDRIIRVDHAGELGADRIYAGQMAVLGMLSVSEGLVLYLLSELTTGLL